MAKKYVSNSPRFTDKDAEIIGKTLEKHFPDRECKPSDLVRLAKNKKSPLHTYFDWDDASAANKWRHSQAVRMIQAVAIVDGNGDKLRKWHSVTIKKGSGLSFVDNTKVQESEDLISQVVNNAWQALKGWQRRYGQYKEFFGVNEAINNLEEHFDAE